MGIFWDTSHISLRLALLNFFISLYSGLFVGFFFFLFYGSQIFLHLKSFFIQIISITVPITSSPLCAHRFSSLNLLFSISRFPPLRFLCIFSTLRFRVYNIFGCVSCPPSSFLICLFAPLLLFLWEFGKKKNIGFVFLKMYVSITSLYQCVSGV